MNAIIFSIIVFILSGVVSFLIGLGGKRQMAPRLGAWGAVVAAVIGLVPAVRVLAGRFISPFVLPWSIPLGSFSLKMDMLSAFFLVIILVMTACAAVYGLGYGKEYEGRKSNGGAWLCYNTLAASMVMVCIADNALLFLVAWEIMALASFFLVAFEHEKNEVRKAAWIYMTATYLGTACLLPMFLLLGSGPGSLNFAGFNLLHDSRLADICFLLALVGFGTKAGIMPFHVWLPEAHPAAPTHVSAIMSGVMIKTGIYGIVRVLTFIGPPHVWWGGLLIAAGAVSGVMGVLFALSQHDLKRLLAYHSVENIGIIFIGLGVGIIGACTGADIVAVLGFAGALLHVVNHALFKGLLFMGAGAVYRQTRTREMDLLGGVLKKMPITGTTFLIGAVAISGLPPLNGFISEFLIYAGSFLGIVRQKQVFVLPLASAVAALALIGGLAAACFTKAFGIVFLGGPRSPGHVAQSEASPLMTVPMIICASLCCIIGLAGPLAAGRAAQVVVSVFGIQSPSGLNAVSDLLFKVSGVSLLLIIGAVAMTIIRNLLLQKRSVRTSVTWDCGYTAGTSRMQYSASSFAQPITDLFAFFLRTKKRVKMSAGYFPAEAHLETETPDVGNERLYRPLFIFVKALLSKFGVLQQGRIQVYVLYLVVALLVLLFWRLR